jgi:uncharacterized protein
MKRKTPVKRIKENGRVDSNGNGRFDLLTNEAKNELLNLYSAQRTRSELSSRLGLSYKGDARDTYKALGYPKELLFDSYWSFYTREHIAKRVVDAPVNACWQKPPSISEQEEGDETQFEEAWNSIVKEKKIWHYMSRVDKLSGIGEFGILLLGFNDGAILEEEVTRASELLYIRPYKQNRVVVEKFVSDPSDVRYGLPELYKIDISTTESTNGNIADNSTSTMVHWSRILHIADELMEDDIYGTPRLMNVYNLISGLHLVAGGSGEMFWRGAFPGLAFILDKDAEIDPSQDMTAVNTEINDYIHDLNRTMRVQGMDIKNLAPQVADPSKHVEVLITLIAGAREIPKRILVGAERGELGGDRDENAWNKKIRERQTNYCDPMMIRPLINRLIEFGVLPEPKDEYEVVWDDITVPTEEEESKVAKTKAETIAVYANSVGASEVLPPNIFLKVIMGFQDKEIEMIEDELGTMLEDDLINEEKDAENRKEIEGDIIAEGIAERKRLEEVAKIEREGN